MIHMHDMKDRFVEGSEPELTGNPDKLLKDKAWVRFWIAALVMCLSGFLFAIAITG